MDQLHGPQRKHRETLHQKAATMYLGNQQLAVKHSSTASQASMKHSNQQSNLKVEGTMRTQSTKDQDKYQDQLKTTRQSYQNLSLNRSARPPQRKVHANFLSSSSSNKSFKTGLQKQDAGPVRATLRRAEHGSDLNLATEEVKTLPSHALNPDRGSSFCVAGEHRSIMYKKDSKISVVSLNNNIFKK